MIFTPIHKRVNIEKLFVTFLFFLITLQSGLSQQGFRFKKISIAGGLSQNTVNCIYQDKDGLIWIGTQDGLNLFNGYSFRHFKYQPNDTSSISDNFIIHITEDSLGYLWIATRNGLNRMDRATYTFRRFFGPDKNRREFHNSFFKTIVLPGGYVLTRKNDFLLIHASTLRYYILSPSQLNIFDDVKYQNFFPTQHSIALLSNEEVLLVRYDRSFIRYPIKIPSEEYITSFLEAKDTSTFFIGTNRSLYFYKNNTLLRILPERAPCKVNAIIKSNDNKYWVGTSHGIYIINPDNFNDIFHVLPEKHRRDGIISSSIISIFQTKNNQVWIGTEYNGINIYDPFTSRFKYISLKTSDISSKETVVWGIYAMSERSVWIGVDDGLLEVSFSHPIQVILRNEVLDWKYKVRRIYQNKIKQRVSALYLDNKQQLWITTTGGGIFRLSKVTGSIKQYLADTTHGCKITDDVLYHIAPGKSEELYFSSKNGITYYRSTDEKFRCIFPSTYLPEHNNFVLSTYWSKSRSSLYICQAHGLSIFIPDSNRMIHYSYNEQDTNSISFPIVSSVCDDYRGNLWISTLGGGICGWNDSQKKFFRIDNRFGLSDEVVYTFVPDDFNKIWFSTNTSVGMLDPNTHRVRMYSMIDVTEGIEFSQNSSHRMSNGCILFGGTGGFVMFQPEHFTKPEAESPLILSDIKFNFRDLSLRDTNYVIGKFFYPEKILLKPGIRSVFFEFAALDYRNQGNIQFAYRLQGYEQNWIYLNNSQRSALYSNLPYGKYIFQVKYRITGQDWYPTMLQIPISVIPPFYQTSMFRYTVIGISIILLIFLVRTIATIRLRRKLRLAETHMRLQEERERISRELHDNIGSQLTYIINVLDNITFRLKPQHIEKEKQRLEELSQFSRNTMKHLRETIFALSKDKYEVLELAEKIKTLATMYVNELDYNIDLNISVNYNPSLDPIVYLNLYRVVQEALQNAMKYSNSKNIMIDLQSTNQYLSIVIKDEGKGFDMSGVITGNGLKNMRKRANEINAKIEINSMPGNGTQISVFYKYDN
ncbi:MAG: histidine kinase [Flavobacteriales bacterium]|nr:histidine kinase [Flavobacteriales bacterium]